MQTTSEANAIVEHSKSDDGQVGPAFDYSADDFAATAIGDIPPGRKAEHEFRHPQGGGIVFPGGPVTVEIVDQLKKQELDAVLVHLEDRTRWQEEENRGRRLQLSQDGVDTAPESVRKFVERMTQQAEPTIGFERRKQSRFRVAKAILVVPVDEHNKPTGAPFQAMTRDISSAGVSFIHTRSITARRLVAEMTCPRGETKQLAMEVLRCRPWSHLYEIAGRWVAKLE